MIDIDSMIEADKMSRGVAHSLSRIRFDESEVSV